MDYELFIDLIKKNAGYLFDLGYQFREVDRNIWFEKSIQDYGYRISFSYTEYGDGFHVKGLRGLKRFDLIENEIIKVIGGELFDFYTIHISPHSHLIPQGLNFETKKGNFLFKLKNESEVLLFLQLVKVFYESDVVSFFEKFGTIKIINEELERLERNKITSLIINAGNTAFYRELVIKSKSNIESFESYYSYILKEFEPHKEKQVFGEIISNLKRLKQNLSPST